MQYIRLLRFLGLRLGGKLSLAFLMLALFGGVIGGTSLLFVERLNTAFIVLADTTVPIVDLTSNLQEDLQRMQVSLLDLLTHHRADEIAQKEAEFAATYDHSSKTLQQLEQLARAAHPGFALSRADVHLAEYRSWAKQIIAAHKATILAQSDADNRSADFSANLRRAHMVLTVFVSQAEAVMSQRENEAKTLLQRQGDLGALETLLGTTFNQAYPILRGAYRMMGSLAELQGTAQAFLADGDADGLAAAEQSVKTKLDSLNLVHRIIASRVKQTGAHADFEVVGSIIDDLESDLMSEKGFFGMHREAFAAVKRVQSLRPPLARAEQVYEEEINQVDLVAHQMNESAQKDAGASMVGARWSVVGGLVGSIAVAFGLGTWFAHRLVARDELIEMQQRERARIQEQNARFDLALSSMSQGLCMYDRDNRLIVMNERYAEMYALPTALRDPGTPFQTILEHQVRNSGFVASDAVRIMDECQAIAVCNEQVAFTRDLADGRSMSVLQTPISSGGRVCTHEDITERRKSEAQVMHMAHHDALTGLPNRLQLREHMERVLSRVRQGEHMAVLYLDLDGFKGVNDTLGHHAGDELLRMVARRLRDNTRETGLVARLGGDEFAILQVDAVQPADSAALAERLVQVLGTPFDVHGQWVEIGTSVGVALASDETSSVDELLRSADIALYRAKAEGRGTWRFFEAGMDVEIQRRRRLESDLRKAVAEEQFEVYYQPLMEAHTQALTGFEALVRWRHPDQGMVSPAEFIPLAEEIGLIRSMGAWVLTRACSDAAGWPEHVKIAVNLSPVQFINGSLVQEVKRALAVSGLPAHRLELEITESVMLQDGDSTLMILHELHDLGVRISMDDFGTGYSSLSYLRRFPFDKIKIDQSFVRNMEQEKGSIEIIRAVVGLGKALGMGVLAEGVETTHQLAALQSEGCDELQGYLFSKPRPIQEVQAIIDRSCLQKSQFVQLIARDAGSDQIGVEQRNAN